MKLGFSERRTHLVEILERNTKDTRTVLIDLEAGDAVILFKVFLVRDGGKWCWATSHDPKSNLMWRMLMSGNAVL